MKLAGEPWTERRRGAPDEIRLLLGALVCGALAAATIPFEPRLLRLFNVHPESSGLSWWRWLDGVSPLWLQTAAVLAGASLLLVGLKPRSRHAGFVLIAGFVLTLLLTTAIKEVAGRLRPLANPERAGALWSPVDLKDDRSFPSGHVSVATAIAAAFWIAGRRGLARNVVWAIPPTMMFGRVCIAAHWPSDVLAGASLGLLATAALSWVARAAPLDDALRRLGPGGSRYWRFLLLVFVWLGLSRVWLELPRGRDPVSGEVVSGFTTLPSMRRVVFDPLFGPPLAIGGEDLRALFVPLAAWGAAALLLLVLLSRRAAVLAVVMVGLWGLIFFGRVPGDWLRAPPDRFLAGDRKGIFIDWHLHGGDPHDGRISESALRRRQEERGVASAIMTPHNRAGAPTALAAGVVGTEWSGSFAESGPGWTAPHVLVLGAGEAVAAALTDTEGDAVAAARRAVDAGALVIVAHLWRSQAAIPGIATFEDFVAAGVHGFEVGNRRRDTDERLLAPLRDLDRACRERGLLRFSFSDDHGIPPGSPCVTFLEGAEWSGPEALDGLRAKRIRAIPLLFHSGDPTWHAPRWLAPPALAFQYFRSLRAGQRLSWFAFAAFAGAWVLRKKRHRYTAR